MKRYIHSARAVEFRFLQRPEYMKLEIANLNRPRIFEKEKPKEEISLEERLSKGYLKGDTEILSIREYLCR